jgi:hypothetical protein
LITPNYVFSLGVNQFQPQTLVIATILLYIDAFFWLINLTRGFPPEVAAIAMLTMASGGWGIANEKKWGYTLAVVASVVHVLLFLTFGLWALNHIEVLIPLLERFVKRQLAILLCRHTIAPRGRKMLVAQTRWNALDGIQSIGPQT